MKLKGKAAIVTGAERGIGRAIALALAEAGASVVVNYHISQADAESVCGDIRNAGGRAIAVRADISKLEEHPRLIQASIENFGTLDILVNNAGIQIHESVLTAKAETWDKIQGVNLRGAYFLSCAAARIMKVAGKGKIVCIVSVHDAVPLRDRAIYSISKAGAGMMMKTLALELAESGIQVNAVSPGAILTGMNRKGLSDPERLKQLLTRIPMGRVGEPRDIGGSVVFLASEDADYITGTTIYVDGGLLLS